MEASTLVLLLILSGALMLIVELFIPGMILGSMGFGLLISAAVYSFVHFGFKVGLTILACESAAVLVGLFFWMKYWPQTRWGSKMMLQNVSGEKSAADNALPCIGDLGKTVTICRPSGTIEVSGKRFDAKSAGEFIDSGTLVRVIQAGDSSVLIRKETEE